MDTEVSSFDNGFLRIHLSLKAEHVDFLKKLIQQNDADNYSNAVRVLIERYIKQSKAMRFERIMMYFVFVMCLVILVILLYPVMVM